jgi:hypothetical protein
MGRMKEIFMEVREKFEDEIPSNFNMDEYLNYRANDIESEDAFLRLGFSNQDLQDNTTHQN